MKSLWGRRKKELNYSQMFTIRQIHREDWNFRIFSLISLLNRRHQLVR